MYTQEQLYTRWPTAPREVAKHGQDAQWIMLVNVLPAIEGAALPMSGIMGGAGGGAVVLVKRIPNPSIIACNSS